VAAATVSAQRERTRPGPRRQTTVSQSQASELTLTVTEVALRPIQVWIRTAGVIDAARTTVTAELGDGRRVKVGQRVRAFSPESRSRMHQATVASVATEGSTTRVRAALMGRPLEASRHFVLEIVTEDGEFLSVPNEAIIESGGTQIVYVQEGEGRYAPKEIQVGVRGELYSQVLGGVSAGEQVVTIGSFFIDADFKLKGS
jgi:hypothetical protein